MEALTKELEDTAADFEATVSSFNDEEFNRVPFEGSWTAGQVAEHILLSVGKMPQLLYSKTKPAGRDPEINIKPLRDMFLNFDLKFEAAEMLKPAEGHHDAKQLITDVLASLKELTDISANKDLTLLVDNFEFPTIGKLTRVELLNFVSVHTQRHVRQMKNIREKL